MALIVGIAGVTGCVMIGTPLDTGEVHPIALVTVNEYVPPTTNPVIVVLVPLPVIAPGLMVQVPENGKPINTMLPVVVQVG